MAVEGFIGRWSRLKRSAESPDIAPGIGADVEHPSGRQALAERAELENATVPVDLSDRPAGGAAVVSGPVPEAGRQSQPARDAVGDSRFDSRLLPSIDSLGRDSDFSMFMRAGVDPGVRVSALKKLFADPHFNRMDGLDIYVDDYSKPDPIPLALIRRLDQSRVLGLGEDEVPDRPAPIGQATPEPSDAATSEALNETIDQAAAPPDPMASAAGSTVASRADEEQVGPSRPTSTSDEPALPDRAA